VGPENQGKCGRHQEVYRDFDASILIYDPINTSRSPVWFSRNPNMGSKIEWSARVLAQTRVFAETRIKVSARRNYEFNHQELQTEQWRQAVSLDRQLGRGWVEVSAIRNDQVIKNNGADQTKAPLGRSSVSLCLAGRAIGVSRGKKTSEKSRTVASVSHTG